MGQVTRVMRKKCYRIGELSMVRKRRDCGGWKSLSTHCKCVFGDVQRIYGFLDFVNISRESVLIYPTSEVSQAPSM